MSHITYVIDLCTFFFSTFDMDKLGKIHQFCWKECLYISGGGGGGGGGAHKHLQISTTLRSYIFAYLRRVTFKLADCTNFKKLFQVVSTDFPFHLLCKKLKKQRKGLYCGYWLTGTFLQVHFVLCKLISQRSIHIQLFHSRTQCWEMLSIACHTEAFTESITLQMRKNKVSTILLQFREQIDNHFHFFMDQFSGVAKAATFFNIKMPWRETI